jgi:hypothetical protein
VTDASLVTVIIGLAASLILIVIGSFFGRTSATTSSGWHLRDFRAPPVDQMAGGPNLHAGEDHMPPCRMSSRAGNVAAGRSRGFG